MTGAVTAVFEELLNKETLQAFEDAWPKDPQVARAEAANIAAILADPNGDQNAQFLIKLAHALIETYPCPLAWISALTDEGAMELRRASRHAKDIPSASRAIVNKLRAIHTKERQLKPNESSASLDRDRVRLRMLTAATLLLKFRQLIGPVAAIGPGWTLMCALGETKDKTLQRKLHAHGANREFRRALYDAVCEATDRWINLNELDSSVTLSRAALWKRTVPIGVDVMGFFGDGSLRKYRSELFAELGLEVSPPKTSLHLAEADAAIIRSALPKRAPEQRYSYLADEAAHAPAEDYFTHHGNRLRAMMPTLMKQENNNNRRMLAARSLARKIERDGRLPADQTEQDQLEIEIENWVFKGDPPPACMRFKDSHLFEEDACRAFLSVNEWPGLATWRHFWFFQDDPTENTSIQDVLSDLQKIRAPFPMARY